MYEVQIIVPHGKECLDMHIGGTPGQLLRTEYQPGTDYDVQTWGAPDRGWPTYTISYQLSLRLPQPARVR